jgi:ribosomal protein S18 acetylase RimI-like enzyme
VTVSLSLVAASPADVDAAFAIYRACVDAMLARGVRQWDAGYPTRATAADAATRGDLFLLVADGEMLGSVILNDTPAPEYSSVAWREPGPALVIHTLTIDPRRQGAGIGRAAMVVCEAYARDHGFVSIRLDAYPGNPAAIALYERLGYRRCGEVAFGYKPAGHERYAVYEKAL